MKNKIGLFISIGILGIILWSSGKMIYLKYYGAEVSGIVLSIYPAGSKGDYHSKYYYYVDGEKYIETVAYHKYSEKDSIIILYSKDYPSISAPKKMIIDYW